MALVVASITSNVSGMAIIGTGAGMIRKADGSIIIAGKTPMSNRWWLIVEKSLAGTLDPAFGANGQVVTDIGAITIPGEISAQAEPDGKILVKTIINDELVQVRYNANGTLDDTFGEGGIQRDEREKLI